MNLAILLTSLDVGGGEYDVIRFSRELSNHGHRLFIVSATGRLKESLTRNSIDHIPIAIHRRSPLAIMTAARRVADLITEEEIDIINPHSIMGLLVAYIACRFFGRSQSRNIPIITTVHNITDRNNDALAVWLINHCATHSIFVSRFEQHRLQAKGLDITRTSIIYSGVELGELTKHLERPAVLRELGIVSNRLVVGIVSRLSAEKGVQDLIKAIPLIIKRVPEVAFLIIGDGPHEKMLKLLARRLGVDKSTYFTGFRKDVPRLLSAMDVFVLPSTQESLPVAVREAMAHARPVVATNVGGIPELITNGHNGLLVPPQAPTALAEAICSLLKDPQRRKTMGQNGRREIEERFTIKRWINDTVLLMENLRFHASGTSSQLSSREM